MITILLHAPRLSTVGLLLQLLVIVARYTNSSLCYEASDQRTSSVIQMVHRTPLSRVVVLRLITIEDSLDSRSSAYVKPYITAVICVHINELNRVVKPGY